MSCPFCEVLTGYQRQVDRRLDTGTFAMSDANAHLLLRMAAQIRNLTRNTMRLVGQEAVPIMLCDLLDGLAEGLIDGLNRKLTSPFPKNGNPALLSASHPIPNGERNPCQAPHHD